MDTITYEADERQPEETASAFLLLVLEYAAASGLFALLESMVRVPMKRVVYSTLHKAQTVVASVVMGCAHTKAINETLGAEVAAAHYLGMARWPDQSQVNRYLTRFTATNVDELGAVHALALRQCSRARGTAGLLVVDIDQCGLVANGKTYELHRKGYFPRKRGVEGYQLSLAYLGAYEEAVALYLDPGNTPGERRLADLVRDVERVLGPHDAPGELVWRLDAGYDTPAVRALLAARGDYLVLKGKHAAVAGRAADRLPLRDWVPVADDVHGIELPVEGGVRRIVYALYQADGTVANALLYTNLPAGTWGVGRLYAFYNERTTIEAFFGQSRHVYNIQNLRSRAFVAIYAFLRFVALTHNLLVWAKQERLAPTELAHATTRRLIQQVARIRARARLDGDGWRVAIPRTSHWAALLIEALVGPPRPIQLALPFTRLHKT